MTKRAKILLIAALCFVGAFGLFGSVGKDQAIAAGFVSTEATLERCWIRGRAGRRHLFDFDDYLITYRFTLQNKRYKKTEELTETEYKQLRNQGTLTVRYSPDDPSVHSVRGQAALEADPREFEAVAIGALAFFVAMFLPAKTKEH